MDELTAEVRSADIESAKRITAKLYRMVDDNKIKNFNIKRITKGKNSVDLSPLIPIIENIDFEEALKIIKESGIIVAGNAYLGIRIAREILSIVKEGIWAYEKIKEKKSQLGVNCRINEISLIKYGRSFGVEPFDTIMTSATPESLENMFLKQKKWGEIKIAQEKYYLIEYIAIFVKNPVGAITHIGKVSHIEYNHENGKSTVILEGEPKMIKPIPYNERWPRHNAHGHMYTTMERIKHAKTLADLYSSLDGQKK